ncbi:MAG: AAA family ATPase [Eubacterium sp.]
MIDQISFNKILTQYKKDLPGKWWEGERFKWECVKRFKDNWKIDTPDPDFAGMLKICVQDRTDTLLGTAPYPADTIVKLAQAVPGEVREMFRSLFNESDDVFIRIENFKKRSDEMLRKYGDGKKSQPQDEHAITTYLWLRYPDKYYMYKYSVGKAVSQALKSNYTFKAGAYKENLNNCVSLFDEIREALSKDNELGEMLKNLLSDSCYPDPEYRTLTMDFGFYVEEKIVKKKKLPGSEIEWSSEGYDPGLSTEEWADLLKDNSVFNETALAVMERMLNYGGQATCKELSLKYGESPHFYNMGSTSLAKRIIKKTGIPAPDPKNEYSKWWPVLYLGKDAEKDEAGAFIWRLRDNLKAALENTDLSAVPLYAERNAKIWKISEGTELTGVPEEYRKELEQRKVVTVDKYTKAKAGSAVSQGQNFVDGIRKGDYFYLCCGSSIRLLGKFTENDAVMNPAMPRGWYERHYDLLADSVDELPYKGTQKWWTPNDNSTCIEIREDEQAEFEELILKPYFGMSLTELLNTEEKADGNGVKMPAQNIHCPAYSKSDFLNTVYISEELYDRMAAVLRHKKNVILQGAPGVGKTFAARRLAYSLMGEKNDDRIAFVQFHQNYSYEDFMMGYRPCEEGFVLRHGVFYDFCKKAEEDPDQKYFLIIDEINRGNLSKIFGELLMLIEKDYRNVEITLAYNGEKFSVPDNLYIIGMMNTADRSLAMIDYALRRRFSFIEMGPAFDSDGFKDYQKSLDNEMFDDLIRKIEELNKEISSDKSLGKGFCIGHSYFCGQKKESCTKAWMQEVVDFDILPMLSEYWFDDESKFQHWDHVLHEVF